ncbi:MAG: four helix bundle protein [Sphingobacteriales bacterium]|nr:four helix bundle protein [Sphingobacteriales bacterium]
MLQLAHKKLEVCPIARELVKKIYLVTADFPKAEQYLIVTQLPWAAVCICSNLAEGSSRISKIEKKRFYEIARASLVGIDTQIEIAVDLGYIKPEQVLTFESKLESDFRMLSKMIQKFS